MSHERIIVVIVLAVLGGLFLWGVSVRDASGESPPAASGSSVLSASPTASSSPVATPASAKVVHWALAWRRTAVRSWRQWNRARSAFSFGVVSFGTLSARSPNRVASYDRWMDAGRGWKHDRSVYHEKFTRLWDRMNNPGGSGWERWRPLVRWVWPANLVNTVIEIMRWESGGNARILNGGYVLPKSAGHGEPNPRAGGLMQNMPAPHHWADPRFNLEYAYHHKYLPAGGFSPWATCNAFN